MTEENRISVEGYTGDPCKIDSNGHCALHNVEIERRKSTQKDVTYLKDKVEAMSVTLTNLVGFKDNMSGGIKWSSILAMVILMGSYTYIYNHIQEAERKWESYKSDLVFADSERKALVNSINSIKIEQGRNDERAAATNSRLSSIDARLAQLVGLMLNSGKISTDQIMKMYTDDASEGKKE